MKLRVTITYIAEEKDWDLDAILDGRSVAHPQAREDLLRAFGEDLQYIFRNAEIRISPLLSLEKNISPSNNTNHAP